MIKKFSIAMLVFCSFQFHANASSHNNELDDKNKQALVPASDSAQEDQRDPRFGNKLPVDVMKLIFLRASKIGAKPTHLRRVSTHWRHSMRYVIPITGSTTNDKNGIPYTNPNDDNFMEDCIRLYRSYQSTLEGSVSTAVLFYRMGIAGKGRALRFEDSPEGTVNLSDCKDMGRWHVYTINESRFRLVGGVNSKKVVTFFAPFHKVFNLLPADAIKKGSTRTDMVILWKWGDDPVKDTYIAYLITKPNMVGSKNMKEHWHDAIRIGGDVGWWKCSKGFLSTEYFRLVCHETK